MPLTDEQWEYLKQAIWNGEQSDGNYSSYNESSGAGGAYQFMPDTWREKANKYGFGEYANVPNATFAPPYVQDSVARGWASELFDKYNGDTRYVLDAWLSGESAADEDYAKGSISTTRSDGGITASGYVERALNDGDFKPTENILDLDVIQTNNPDQNVTNTDNLRPEAIYGANTLGYYMKEKFGVSLLITGGAEKGYHAKSASGHGHEDGWKIDVANDEIQGGTEEGKAFKAFCNENGWSCNWEDNHWDIDFSGTDTRDPQSGGYSGNLLGDAFSVLADNAGYDYMSQMMNTKHDEEEYLYNQYYAKDTANMSEWDAFWTGFESELLETGIASFAEHMYGNFFVSNNPFGTVKELSKEDIDYVTNAFPDDKETQQFILLNAKDSAELKWLTNRRLEQRKRREQIDAYNAGCVFTMANAGRIASMLADPINYIPIGTAFAGLKITARLGNAIQNVSKVARIAEKTGKAGRIAQNALVTGAVNVPITIADDFLRNYYGGQQREYGLDSVNAFLGGTVLGGIGGLFKNLTRNKKISDIAKTADTVETKAIENSLLDTDKIRTETFNEALKMHDKSYGDTIKSNYYKKLEKNNRVVAMKADEAKKLVSKYGIDLPKEAKAFYVPNEDYTILLTDRVQGTGIDKVLSHEFGVHAGLKAVIGEKNFDKLLNEVTTLANKDGHIFNEARRLSGEYDPEEILAYAVEHNMVSDNFVSKLKGFINNGFKREGLKARITSKQVQEVMRRQMDAKHFAHNGIYFNPDGSTAFAGIKYSKDNVLNPQNFLNYYELEPSITKNTQKDLPTTPLKIFGKAMEQGFWGSGIKSMSNTIRNYVVQLYDDPRGRGIGNVQAMPAEINKERIMGMLSKPYLEYASIRSKWCLKNKKLGEGAFKAFDRIVYDAYNAKYGGNTANVIRDIPDEVNEAVEKLREYRELQILEGKNSSRNAGSNYDNLIEADWEPVDHELWRVIDIDKRVEFKNHFNNPEEEAPKFLADYMKAFAKRDVIKAKIERNIAKENKKIQEQNEKFKNKKASLDTKVTEADIDRWIDEHIEGAVHNILGQRSYDPTLQDNMGNLGSLSFLKARIPMDTTGVVKFPDGTEFSFDNNLRSFDLDSIVFKNMNRFAGECAVKAVFGSQKNLDNVLSKAQKELKMTVEDLKSDRAKEHNDYAEFIEGINTLRGLKPRDEVLDKKGVLARIFTKLAYYSNGANMGFAQLGELCGSIAYGGISHIFDMIKPLADIAENVKWGKESANVIRDVEAQMFGESLESKIFTVNWGDRVARDALTDRNSLMNKALIGTSNVVSNLSKITSALNYLPKMTDTMTRKMRGQMIMDSIRWANGENLGKFRNPFSKSKLKGCHVSAKEAKQIQSDIQKYTTKNINGDIVDINIKQWQKDNPISYDKWYYMIQKQADRAILPGNRIGNKNLFKDKNCITRMMLQFKDYSLRAINGQTFRMMTARDVDDGLNAMLSMFTNAGGYGAKALATFWAMKATGDDEKAEDYYNRMLSSDNFIRAGVLRSAMFAPASFANDILEATGAVDTTTRTTVTRGSYGQPQDMGDFVGNAVAQFPAIQQAGKLYDIYNFLIHEQQDTANKRDFKKFMQAFPLPNHIISTAIINKFLIDNADYPDKRPKVNGE